MIDSLHVALAGNRSLFGDAANVYTSSARGKTLFIRYLSVEFR